MFPSFHYFSDEEHGLLFTLLLYYAIGTTILLLTIIYPFRLWKRMISWFFNTTFTWRGAEWKIYHILVLNIGFFITLFAFLKLSVAIIMPGPHDSFQERKSKLDKKWINEMMTWLTFLIIVELVTIYRSAVLFEKENKIIHQIEEDTKELERLQALAK